MGRLLFFLKKNIAFVLALACTLVLIFPAEAQAKSSKSSGTTYTQGDDISFGKLDGSVIHWTVLSYDTSTKVAFVVSRYSMQTASIQKFYQVLDKAYPNKDQVGYVRWQDSMWRSWLNNSFYTNCFSKAEKAMIQKTTLTATEHQTSIMNFYHDTTLDAYYLANGEKNSLSLDIYNSQTTTTDYVFFLSSDEYTTYKDTIKTQTCEYPLRTNSYDDPYKNLFVDEKHSGQIKRQYAYAGNSIRPALYIKLGESDATTTSSGTTTTGSSTTTSTASTTSSTSTASTSSTKASTTASTSTNSTKSTATTTSTKKKVYANNASDSSSATGGTVISLPNDPQKTLKKNSNATVAIDLDYLNFSGKDYTVTYKSSDASVFTVDSSGKITTGATKGSATLTVRMKKSNGKTYTMTCRIDVS